MKAKALSDACAERDNPDPQQRAEKSREEQAHPSHLQRMTVGSAVERCTGILDHSSVQCSQSETQSASKNEANERMGTDSTGARMTRLKSDMEIPFFKGGERTFERTSSSLLKEAAVNSQRLTFVWGYETSLDRVEGRMQSEYVAHSWGSL